MSSISLLDKVRYWSCLTHCKKLRVQLFSFSRYVRKCENCNNYRPVSPILSVAGEAFVVPCHEKYIKGKLHWMYTCNKVTEKRHIMQTKVVSIKSNIERNGCLVRINAKYFQARLLCSLAHVYRCSRYWYFVGSLSVSESFIFTWDK